MLLDVKEVKILSPRERDLIVAYLSYALDDVRALSEVGSHFLQMTIASLIDDSVPDAIAEARPATPPH